jgi:hypothetical protein
VTSDKKFQVFVSSTYTDLQDARQELMLALLSMGMIPTGMEMYPSDQNGQWKMIQKVIDECDYYVVLMGGRYGTLSPIGLSYTHREYVYAATKKKPVIVFAHEAPEFLPAEQRESSREGEVRFRDFRKLVQHRAAIFRQWNSPADLAEVVRKSMPVLVRQNPAAGWVRAGQAVDLSELREVQNLKKRIEELEKEKHELTSGWRPPLENLARGSDTVALQYSCNVYIKGDCKVTMTSSTLSWDEVFSTVAPQMLNEVSERVMRDALEEAISERALGDVQKTMSKAHAVRNVVLSTASFNQIKIHLRALGLIRKSISREDGGQTWWYLTPLGNSTMTQLLAQTRR